MTEGGMSEKGTVAGGSMTPSLNLCSNTLAVALSMSLLETRPSRKLNRKSP